MDRLFDVAESLRIAARDFPENAAYVSGSTVVSYEEFYRRVCDIAVQLQKFQSGEDTKTAIILPKSLDLYAGMYAVLCAGGQYSPFNVESPRDRNSAILERYMPDLILTSRDLAHLIPKGLEEKTIFVEDIVKSDRELSQRKGNFAYTIFTSGSTGVPKGVHISRQSLNVYIEDSIKLLGFLPGLRVSQHPNVAFDLSVLDIYATLSSGATLVPVDGAVDKGFPAKFIHRNDIQIWISVPRVIDLMDGVDQLTSDLLNSVRTFFFCGEPFLPLQLKKLSDAVPAATIFNAYGPTEATVSCTLRKFEGYRAAYEKSPSLPIGEAFGDNQIKLVGGSDDRQGEIYIYGEQVANGYWRDGEGTNEKFGFDEILKKRYFKTGDWAKFEDGEMTFVGRMDRQIKRFGYRVELGEIEFQIRKLTGSNQVAVIESDGNLIAFMAESALLKDKLRDQLANILPKYMLPDELYLLEALPKNQNDKVNYAKLKTDIKDGRFNAVA